MVKLTVIDKDLRILATAKAATFYYGLKLDEPNVTKEQEYPYAIWMQDSIMVRVSENRYEFWKITKRFKNGNIVIQHGYDAPIKGTKIELEAIILNYTSKKSE